MSFSDNKHLFYPQNDNKHYDEKKALIVGFEWLIQSCNENKNFDKELKALLSTKSSKIHRIAYIIRDVVSMKKLRPEYVEYFEAITMYAKYSMTIMHNNLYV